VMGSNQKDLNEHFQSTISIEVVDTRLSNRGDQLAVQGRLSYDTCFSKLAWGQHETMSKGLVVGGMENGYLTFWDPTKIATSDKQSALICVAKEPHTDCITDVDFNSKTLKYLVSSSIDGKVIVWTISDLENIESQEVLGQKGQQSPIMSVRWNKTTAFILAAGDNKGQIYILDLRRQQKVLMVIRSPSVGVTKNIAWHPSNNMELAVCWKNGEAEMWDLANAMTPTATFHGETKSEFLTWCPHDENLIAIAGGDGVVRVYHTKRQPNLIHHFLLGEANFILQWNPQHAGMLAASSVSGKISVRTLDYTGNSHVPAWLQRKAGVQLAFGGKYAYFHPTDSDQPPLSTINLDVVRADPVVVQRAQDLQQALLDVRQKGISVEGLIGSRLNSSVSTDDRTVWEMMSLYYNPEGLKAFKSYLGFSHQNVDPAQIKKHVSKPAKKQQDPTSTAFFDQLSEKNLLEAAEKEADDEDDKPTGDRSSATDETAGSKGPSPMEEKIQNALVIADYASAVELALKEGLFADALAFAHEGDKRGGQEALWNRALKAYFTAHKNRFISQTLKRVVYGDLKELVQTSDLKAWKETIAIILTYGHAESASLIRALCDRLVTEGNDTFAAVQACICSGDCNRMADLLTKVKEAGNQPESLHKSVEKLLIFASLRPLMQCALGGYEDVLQSTFAAYVDMLTSNGAIVEAQYILGCTIDILRSRGVAVGKDYQLMLQMLNEALGAGKQQQRTNQRMQQPDPRQAQHGQRPSQGRQPSRGGQARQPPRQGRQPPRPVAPAPRLSGQRPAPSPHRPPQGGAPAFRTGVPGQPQMNPVPSATRQPGGRPTRPTRPAAPSRPQRPTPARAASSGSNVGGAQPPTGAPPPDPSAVQRSPKAQPGFFGQNPVKKHHRGRRSAPPAGPSAAAGQQGMPGPHHSPRAVTQPQRPGMAPSRPLSQPGGHAPPAPGGYAPQWQQQAGAPQHHAQQAAPMRPARPVRPARPPRR